MADVQPRQRWVQWPGHRRSFRTRRVPSSATLTTHAAPPVGQETRILPRSTERPGCTVNSSIGASPWSAGIPARSMVVSIGSIGAATEPAFPPPPPQAHNATKSDAAIASTGNCLFLLNIGDLPALELTSTYTLHALIGSGELQRLIFDQVNGIAWLASKEIRDCWTCGLDSSVMLTARRNLSRRCPYLC